MSDRRFEFDDGTGVRKRVELTTSREVRWITARMGPAQPQQHTPQPFNIVGSPREIERVLDRLARRSDASVAPRAPAAAEPAVDATLEDAIRADPDADGPYLVYADWLSERGDPRAELISLQARGLNARAEAWIDAHVTDFLGELRAGSEWPVELDWHLGFIRGARARPTEIDHVPLAFLIEQLLALPSARFLRTLVLGQAGRDGLYTDVIATLARLAPPTLRKLVLADVAQVSLYRGDATYDLRDLGPLLAVLPELRELTVGGRDVVLDGIDAPRLRRLALEVACPTRQAIAAIADADWPALEELDLWIGAPHDVIGARVQVAQLRAILESRRMPRLRRLAIRGCPFVTPLVKILHDTRLFRQLTHLDLSYGALGEAGVHAILMAADAYRHLELLDLGNNPIAPADENKLARTGLPIRIGQQGTRSHFHATPGALRRERRAFAHAALEAAFHRHPDDERVRAALVDALRAEGDPRGEAIRLEAAGLDDEAEAWRRRHGFAFYGDLAADVGRTLAVDWRHGRIRRARLERAPASDVGALALVDRLRRLLDLPSTRELGELVIGPRDPGSMAAIVAALVHRRPERLRRLHLGDGCAFAPPYLEECHLGTLWPALPHLEELHVRAERVLLGQVIAPALERLTIECPELRPGNLRVLLDAPPPELRHLALRHTGDTNALVRALAASPLLQRLTTLDLAHGALDAAGARLLATSAARFAHLERLDLTGQALDAEARAVLAGAGLTGLVVDPVDRPRAPSGPPSRLPRLVVLADPAAPRLAAFQHARTAAGLPLAHVVDWRRVLARPEALFDDTDAAAPHVLRIDAPPRRPTVTPAGVLVDARDHLIEHVSALATLAELVATRPGWRVLTPPATLMTLLDGGLTAAELGRAGVPVPRSLQPASLHADLCARMDEEGVTAARLRLPHPGGSPCVAVFARTPAGELLSTSVRRAGGELAGAGVVRRVSDPEEVAALVSDLLLAGAHPEAAWRSARLVDQTVELQVLLVAGEPVFVEAVENVRAFDDAASRRDRRRVDLAWFRTQLPAGVYEDALASCRRVHAAFPTVQLGVTIAFGEDFAGHLVTGVIGFDDHLPGPPRTSTWIYDHEIAPLASPT